MFALSGLPKDHSVPVFDSVTLSQRSWVRSMFPVSMCQTFPSVLLAPKQDPEWWSMLPFILKIDNSFQVVDSSLKDQEIMVVRFSKSVQKKGQNKTKEKKRKEKETTKNKETPKQTNRKTKKGNN